MQLSKIGEFGLIDRLKKGIQPVKSVVKGIGDDAAVVKHSANKHLLLTADMLVEDVHFTAKMSAAAIGHKAVCCSISDIAAMGGLPKYALVSIGLSPKKELSFVEGLYRGMNKAAGQFGVAIVGGDTVKSQKTIIHVSLTGEAARTQWIARNGAKPGDQIFVSGCLGNSLKTGHHLRFMPRIAEAQFLINHCKLTAMMDVSDGLAADLGHILKSSGVGADIVASSIPLRRGATLNNALYDGEDFELLFTLSKRKAKKFKSLKNRDFTFIHIGEITDKEKGFNLIDDRGCGKEIKNKGFRHF